MSKTPQAWVRQLYVTYAVTLAVWLIGFIAVLVAELQLSFSGSWFGASGTAIMAVFGVGPAYFTIQSLRLRKLEGEELANASRRLFAIQKFVGVPLLVGAILGALPAAINIPALFFMSPVDQLSNAGLLVPWAMVYVFTITHLIVMSVRRGLRVSAQPESPPDHANGETHRGNSSKLPIAPNLFLVGALLLGYFTVDVEFRAWQMARNGELTQLDSTGPVFSFFQFIDFTIGNAAALVVLIFGIINWPRDTVTFRKFTTPIVAAVALAVSPGTVALGVVNIVGLSDEASARSEFAQVGSDWINNIVEEGIPQGFNGAGDMLDCGAENCVEDPDSTVTFSRTGDYESNAKAVCTWSLDYATQHGATTYAINPNYDAVSLDGELAAALQACVTTLETLPSIAYSVESWSPTFRMAGELNDVPFLIDLVQIRWGTQSSDPGAHNYRMTVWTNFQPDELLPGQDQLSQGTREINDLLTAIGQARLGNPTVNPNDGELIRGALKTYPHEIPVTPIAERDGTIWFLEVETSDGGGVMCLSIGPWNEETEGVPDPGTGYGVSSAESFAQLKEFHRFGEQAWGKCAP